ncbi:MAG: DMT family transporter [Pseudomonadota bacterium]
MSPLRRHGFERLGRPLMARLQGPALGAGLITGAMLAFMVMQGFIKAADVPAGQAVFFRSFFALPVILLWLWHTGHLHDGLKTERWQSHALRGIVGSTAMALGFAGLVYLPLPEVTAIRFVTPIMLLVLAAIMLGERFRLFRMGAVLLGFGGVLIIIWPRLGGDLRDTATLGAMLTLGSAALAALAQVFVKGMAGRESTAAIVFYFSLTATALGLATLPFGWDALAPWQAVYLVLSGFIGGVGQIMLTSSYRHADAGALAPFTYSSMLWSILLGWLWFAEIPTAQMLLGSLIVIAAGAIIVWRERQLGKDETARRKVRAKGLQ